jgi:hypothetical protein
LSDITIFARAKLPAALGQAWLQHMRDFDSAHPGCHFEILGDAPDQTLAEIVEMMKLNPGFSFNRVIEREAVVHILNLGLPLCLFTRAMPVDWPPNHKWVGAEDSDLRGVVNCDGCMAVWRATHS